MKIILVLFVMITVTTLYSQNDEDYVDSMVTEKMDQLKKLENAMYFFRKNYCLGDVKMFKMPDNKLCFSKSTYYAIYVFWKADENKLNIQKFDNCGSFKPLSIDLSETMSNFIKNSQSLKTQIVKPYVGEKVDDQAFGNMAVQACRKDYRFVFNNDVFEKSFKDFDLTNDSKYKNLNADHNKSLMLIKLDSEVSSIINNLEESERFLREN